MLAHKEIDGSKHPKQDFQVERLAFFSDAVFAIAITLLVIEFKVPHVTKETTAEELWHEVLEMKFKLISVLLSFGIIANYWLKHHLLFKHIHNYNSTVLRLNLLALLPIIFFPFSTAFVYESSLNTHVLQIPFRVFLVNNIAASFLMYYLYWQVTVKHKHLSYAMNAEDKQQFTINLLIVGISFLLVFLLSFIVPLEYAIYGVLPLALVRLKEKFFKKSKTKK